MNLTVENDYLKAWHAGGVSHKISLIQADIRRGNNTNEVIIVSSDGTPYPILCNDCVINGTTYNTQDDVISTLEPFLVSVPSASSNTGGGGNTGADPLLESVVVNDEQSGVYSLDARTSKFNGDEVGALEGRHYWVLSRQVNTVDLLGATQPIQIVEGSNVQVNGVEVEKAITGNSWDTSFYSQQAFDPLAEDFAISWLIESTTGTIREMAGLDDNPSQNNSYSSMEYAVYQVNNYFYSSVYEKGAAIIIPNYSTFYFAVGDRCGIRCIDGVVEYFVLRGSNLNIIYRSLAKAETPLYFKAALNRGSSSSGHSNVGAVEWHVAKKIVTNSVTFDGGATVPVSEEAISLMRAIGFNLDPASKYSKLDFTNVVSGKYENAGTPFPLDFTHGYYAGAAQSIGGLNI